MKSLFISLMVLLTFGIQAQDLAGYQRLAAEQNPGLQARYKTFEAALQKVAQVGSLPDPNISFGYFISPVETRVGPQRVRLSLTQMFPWFGTLKAQREVAALSADAAYQEFLNAQNKLFYDVSMAYFPIFEVHQLMLLEQRNLELLNSYKDLSRVKFQNGKGLLVDVLRADLMCNDASSNLAILTQKKKALSVKFNKLLNQPADESIILPDSLQLNPVDFDNQKDSLLMTNPLLQSMDYRIQAQQMSEQVAIKQGLPKIGVGLDYVLVGERKDVTMADNGKDILMPMISVSLPVFRSKYHAAKKESQLMQASYVLQKEDLQNQLIGSYAMTQYKLDQNRELIKLYDLQIQESQQSLNLLYATYSNSGSEFNEVLLMLQQLLKYQKMKVSALVQYQIAQSELYYLTAQRG